MPAPPRRRLAGAALAAAAMWALAACGSDDDAAPSTDRTEATMSTTPDEPPSETSTSGPGGDAVPSSAPVDGSIPTGVQRLVDVAVADLVSRHDIADPSEITVVTVEEVTWRNAGLGCPQKGMQYAQVLTPGIRIVLAHDGTEYAYHGGGNREPFYCPAPETPAPGS